LRLSRNRRAACTVAVFATALGTTIALLPTAAAAARPDRTPPTAPSNVRVTGVAETSVSLAWNASTDNSGSVRYVIEMVDRPFSFGPYQSASGTVRDSTLLPPATTHRLRVRAYDAAYNYSAPSNVVTVTTLADVQPPTTPTNVTLVAATPHTVKLRWSPSTDNVGWPSDVTYRVRQGGAVVGSSTSLNGAPVPFEMRHLPRGAVLSDDTTPAAGLEYEFFIDGQLVLFNNREFVYPIVRGSTTGWVTAPAGPGTYSFAVRAVDAAGNVSPPSNAITVTVTAGY
jgi:chitodextrinase